MSSYRSCLVVAVAAPVVLLPFLMFVWLGWPGDPDSCTLTDPNGCFCEAYDSRCRAGRCGRRAAAVEHLVQSLRARHGVTGGRSDLCRPEATSRHCVRAGSDSRRVRLRRPLPRPRKHVVPRLAHGLGRSRGCRLDVPVHGVSDRLCGLPAPSQRHTVLDHVSVRGWSCFTHPRSPGSARDLCGPHCGTGLRLRCARTSGLVETSPRAGSPSLAGRTLVVRGFHIVRRRRRLLAAFPDRRPPVRPRVGVAAARRSLGTPWPGSQLSCCSTTGVKPRE